jgi:hypothetical protein
MVDERMTSKDGDRRIGGYPAKEQAEANAIDPNPVRQERKSA